MNYLPESIHQGYILHAFYVTQWMLFLQITRYLLESLQLWYTVKSLARSFKFIVKAMYILNDFLFEFIKH